MLDTGSIECAFARSDKTIDHFATLAKNRVREIQSLLGYAYGPVAVHRDDLISFGGPDGN